MNQAPATTAWEAPPATESTGSPQEQTPGRDSTRARLAALQPSGRQIRFPSSSSGAAPAGSEQPSTPAPASARSSTPAQAPARELPPLRVIGQAATMFIIAEGPEGLYLIDQHAAHERILYEQMAADLARGQVPAQPLLEPETVTVPLDDAAHLEALLPTLHALGLEVEAFGPGTFLVRTMPAPLTQLPIPDLIADIAASMDERTPVEAELEELVIRKICKRAAVKAGQVLSPEEMKRLIDDLEQTANPRTCPHGRPTILQISMTQLIRQFGRGG
jgi:DNA mismatch repair protein MutL